MHYLVQMSPENYLNGVWYDDFPSDYVNGDVPCIFFSLLNKSVSLLPKNKIIIINIKVSDKRQWCVNMLHQMFTHIIRTYSNTLYGRMQTKQGFGKA